MAGCAFLWSTAGILIKLLDWNPFAIACGRSLVAAVFLYIWMGRRRFKVTALSLGAALALAATMLLFVFANKHTTAANAILMQYGSPIYTAFLGYFLLREKIHIEHYLALLFVAAGMVLLLKDDLGGGSPAGNIAALASGVTFSLYFILMRKQTGSSPLESNLLAHLITAALALAVALFLPAPSMSPKSVAVILALGIFQIGIANILIAYGILRVTALQGIIVAGIEPVFNPIWVFLATGEMPGPSGIAGSLVIFAAVLGSSIVTMKRKSW